MKLMIDNLDGSGPHDYSSVVEMSKGFRLTRKLNAPPQLIAILIGTPGGLTMPSCGARVIVERDDGSYLFTGYMNPAPSCSYAGWADGGAQYEYELAALGDVALPDQKTVPLVPSFVARTAGSAFSQLTSDVMAGFFDLSEVEGGDAIPYQSADPSTDWAFAATEIAVAGRCSYHGEDGKLFFAPLAASTYALTESDPSFAPDGLQLISINRLVNDLTVLGELEPAAHVKDYFVGDGYTATFYMSQIPFTRRSEVPISSRTILDEEYTELDPTHWIVTDPLNAISAGNGELVIAGGTGQDGQTRLDFIEQVELGGATVLIHGDVVFNAASNGVIGGLYTGAVAVADCVAGFRITPSGANCNIQALLLGSIVGTPLATQSGHHYVFATYLYPTEIYRMQQVYHSSLHPSGNARGGNPVTCNVRVVLQVQDIDPANPASRVAPATVLYDDVVSGAPGFCTYTLINAATMQCTVAFTYLYLATDALVRTTMPDESPVTVAPGSLISGAQCRISSTPALEFYSQYIPPANEAIEVSYRGQEHAMARVVNSASILAHQNGADNGVRGAVRHVAIPAARTSADCEVAALAIMDDAGQGWAGEYQAWNTTLPGGAEDIFPGDGLAVNVPSRGASFLAVAREVDLTVLDLGGENVQYTVKFVDAGDPSLAFGFGSAAEQQAQVLTPIDVSQVGTSYIGDLNDAEVTTITSTTVTIDAGTAPPVGGGIEVRYSDMAWGAGNNRNLVGRFTSKTFTLPRYARGQTYYLRSYDGSSPAKYSRYSTALHVDYPL